MPIELMMPSNCLILCPLLLLPSVFPSIRAFFYLGFSYLGRGVSLHDCFSKAQLLLLTLDKVAPPDFEHGVAPLCPPVPVQPPLLGCGVAPPSHCPWPRAQGCSSRPPPLASGTGWLLLAVPALLQPGTLCRCPRPRSWGNSSWPPPLGMGSSRLLPLTSDLG